MTDMRESLTRTVLIHSGPLATHYQDEAERLVAALLPVIAAHEAEVAGRILDRIDALHAGIDALNVQVRPHGRVVQVCVACGTDDGNWQQHPSPTRRLTAEIRGELSHG